MAQLPTPRNLWRNKKNGKVYQIGYTTQVKFPGFAFPTPRPVAMYTLKTVGKDPDGMDFITVSHNDLNENYERHDPIQAAQADSQRPGGATRE